LLSSPSFLSQNPPPNCTKEPHTNCPVCRAPIVKSTVQSLSPKPNVDNSSQGEET